MRGTFIAVVGPSGAGKDTLINAAVAARTDLVRARRVIAPPRAAVGEDAEMIEDAAFEARRHRGDFALDWLAHGYRYAIPASVEAALEQGRHVIANISRNSLAEAAGRFSPFLAIHIDTAPKVLAARLAARGRESESEILRRLERAQRTLPEGVPVVTVDNSGPVQAATLAFIAALPAPLPAETAR